jgi:Peptidase family M1 domain
MTNLPVGKQYNTKMNKKITSLLLLSSLMSLAHAQVDAHYWQQKVKYKLSIQLNEQNHQFNGKTELEYTNLSPDTLSSLYFHLYFNAFQPSSDMDLRSLWIADPDPRVVDRISKLAPNEYGHQHIQRLTLNGKEIKTIQESGTIAIIPLNEQKILPGQTAKIQMDWYGQVPIQIRRSGRDNAEGVDYSMCQWYPKICAYDKNGWHPNPYVGREFYGEYGTFDVEISMNQDYVIGGTGEITNEANHKGTKTWTFHAENVHDFVWAADKDYQHDVVKMENGLKIHFYYLKNQGLEENWKKLEEYTPKMFEYMNAHFGQYPYPVYSVIQGGDGGMEYPMATLITGKRKVGSLVGVTAHELAHSWYQGVLGFNESLYGWMDEGFTSFASDEVMDVLFPRPQAPVHLEAMNGYVSLATSGKEEPMNTHADHYNTNFAYGAAVYNKGETYLYQLKGMMGDELFYTTMKRFFNTYRFKHPTDLDFIHVAEKQSHWILDWYHEYMVNSTKTINYAIDTVFQQKIDLNGDEVSNIISLRRISDFPMPLELLITTTDGNQVLFNIPIDLMRVNNQGQTKKNYLDPWRWVETHYEIAIPGNIQSIQLDPKSIVADIDRTDNHWPRLTE